MCLNFSDLVKSVKKKKNLEKCLYPRYIVIVQSKDTVPHVPTSSVIISFSPL